MKSIKFCIVFLLSVIICGCRTIPDASKEMLAKPVNCSSAKDDIVVLEREKNSVAEQARALGTMVFPTSAVAGILSGDYSDRAKVAAGDYNRDIEKKIQEIKSTCGIE